MMKKLKTICLILMIGFPALLSARDLHFKNGEFKIIQFTDTHIDYENGPNDPVFDLIKEIVTGEHPDLVIFSGDIVVKEGPLEVYQRIEALCASLQVKWAVVLGNHDEEYGTSGVEIVEMLKKFPNCLTTRKAGIKGASNFVLPILGENNKTKAVIYGLDSNSSSKIEDRVDGYDWFGFDQIAWYQKTSAGFARDNGGKPLPSLAFFHIPFTEYNDAWIKNPDTRVGVKNEQVCCPDVNSGMFTAMVECNDVMGTFTGHDHVNDYIGVLNNIALAYGRCSGGENAYGELPDGGRVIVLKEGRRSFDTWIHEKGGNIVYRCSYPESFAKKEQKKQ
jgi:predicted phosphodiesterase